VRAMGRNARGVRGMGLRENDRVVGMSTLPAEDDEALQVLTICAKGYGKQTPASEYRTQSRAGLGLITIKVNERNGEVVENLLVHPDDHIIVITSQGKVIRTTVDGISVLGRNTQGVRIIRMGEGERVVAAARMLDDGDKGEVDASVVARPEEVSTEYVGAAEAEGDDAEGDEPESDAPEGDEGEE
jgi:DNA gyrase subunit A